MSEVRVTWYESVIKDITDVAPVAAHQKAAALAAGAAAGGIRSTYTGTLARDVAVPKPVGPTTSEIGSKLPYAAIEHFGGTIQGNPLLYIHGRGVSSSGKALRSQSFRGPAIDTQGNISPSGIVAVVEQVQHRGKHYLDAALAVYPTAFTSAYRSLI